MQRSATNRNEVQRMQRMQTDIVAASERALVVVRCALCVVHFDPFYAVLQFAVWWFCGLAVLRFGGFAVLRFCGFVVPLLHCSKFVSLSFVRLFVCSITFVRCLHDKTPSRANLFQSFHLRALSLVVHCTAAVCTLAELEDVRTFLQRRARQRCQPRRVARRGGVALRRGLAGH